MDTLATNMVLTSLYRDKVGCRIFETPHEQYGHVMFFFCCFLNVGAHNKQQNNRILPVCETPQWFGWIAKCHHSPHPQRGELQIGEIAILGELSL